MFAPRSTGISPKSLTPFTWALAASAETRIPASAHQPEDAFELAVRCLPTADRNANFAGHA